LIIVLSLPLVAGRGETAANALVSPDPRLPDYFLCQLPGAFETLLEASEKRPRSTFLRKNTTG
jgi:hypothetical protein